MLSPSHCQWHSTRRGRGPGPSPTRRCHAVYMPVCSRFRWRRALSDVSVDAAAGRALARCLERHSAPALAAAGKLESQSQRLGTSKSRYYPACQISVRDESSRDETHERRRRAPQIDANWKIKDGENPNPMTFEGQPQIVFCFY